MKPTSGLLGTLAAIGALFGIITTAHVVANGATVTAAITAGVVVYGTVVGLLAKLAGLPAGATATRSLLLAAGTTLFALAAPLLWVAAGIKPSLT